MKSGEPITLFEHERLRIGERGFGQKHFERLVRWNEANGDRFFTIGHKAIKCTQYVGVVQVGDLVVQVLPKADRTGDDKKWKEALLTMLRTVHRLPLTSTNETHLHRRHSSILDFFYDLYVQDVHGLVRRGLVKKYRRRSGNLTALKGRIDWPIHLRDNLLHKERFHVQHQVYDRDHLLHALLKQALGIVRRTTVAPLIAGRVDDVSWAFEEVTDLVLDRRDLERIRLDRKTKPYARAVDLARMIVLGHSPDVHAGDMPLVGLLFNMNDLFERFVLRVLHRAADAHPELDVDVTGQARVPFWARKVIKPDIVLRVKREEAVETVIMDTKWKVPRDGQPADADLKQMFAYNVQLGSTRSVLLYPSSEGLKPTASNYHAGHWTSHVEHGCGLAYADLFDEGGKLRPEAGGQLLTELLIQ